MGHGHVPVQPLIIAFSVSSQMQSDGKPDPWATSGKVVLLGAQSPSKEKVGIVFFASFALLLADRRAADMFLQLLKTSCLFSLLLGQSRIPSSNGSQT